MKKILILAANPTDTTKLRLDEEVREIKTAHRKAANLEEIEIISESVVGVDDLCRLVLYHKPNILHFCGDDGLVLENQSGQKQFLSSESLAGLFTGRNIEIEKGNYNEKIEGDYLELHYHEPTPKEPFKPIKYIPKIGSHNFVGRQEEL